MCTGMGNLEVGRPQALEKGVMAPGVKTLQTPGDLHSGLHKELEH